MARKRYDFYDRKNTNTRIPLIKIYSSKELSVYDFVTKLLVDDSKMHTAGMFIDATRGKKGTQETRLPRSERH